MALPLVIITGVVIWVFTTIVKWRIAKNYQYENKLDDETLDKLRRGNMTDEKRKQAMENFRKKQEADEQAHIEASRGKTLFDEVDDFQRNGRKRNKRIKVEYTPDMFHDTVSRLHEERMKKSKLNQ